MTRTQTLRTALQWSQTEMGTYLGVAQPTIFRLEAGQKEPGPIARLLNLLADRMERPDLKVEVEDVATFVTHDGNAIEKAEAGA